MMEWNFNNETPIYLQIIDRFKMDIANGSLKPGNKVPSVRDLAHFIYNGINMLNIQSRPISDKAWEYRFFVDFEGRFTDTAVQNALRGIREEAIALKILGTY